MFDGLRSDSIQRQTDEILERGITINNGDGIGEGCIRIKFQLETMIRKKRVQEYFDWPDAKPVWKNITSYVTFVHRRGYRSRMRPKDYHHHNLTNSSSFEDSFLEEGSGP